MHLHIFFYSEFYGHVLISYFGEWPCNKLVNVQSASYCNRELIKISRDLKYISKIYWVKKIQVTLW